MGIEPWRYTRQRELSIQCGYTTEYIGLYYDYQGWKNTIGPMPILWVGNPNDIWKNISLEANYDVPSLDQYTEVS